MDNYGNHHEAVGTPVVYVDEVGVKHTALVTTVHGQTLGENAINLVYVSGDESQTDPYGRQIARASSVSAEGPHAAHGRYYYVLNT
jgi:hypothetical protein